MFEKLMKNRLLYIFIVYWIVVSLSAKLYSNFSSNITAQWLYKDRKEALARSQLSELNDLVIKFYTDTGRLPLNSVELIEKGYKPKLNTYSIYFNPARYQAGVMYNEAAIDMCEQIAWIDLKRIAAAISKFIEKNKDIPKNLEAVVSAGVGLSDVPESPWGSPYVIDAEKRLVYCTQKFDYCDRSQKNFPWTFHFKKF